MKKFGYPNSMLAPRLEKVVVNMGISEAAKDKGVLQAHLNELALMTGQKPILTKARKSIANFKLRQGQAIGAKVTLRGKRMYEMVDRFINIVAPRIRDFRGFRRRAGSGSNYTVGLETQEVFPEINLDELQRSQGLSLTFVTTSSREEELFELLSMFGMPFTVT